MVVKYFQANGLHGPIHFGCAWVDPIEDNRATVAEITLSFRSDCRFFLMDTWNSDSSLNETEDLQIMSEHPIVKDALVDVKPENLIMANFGAYEDAFLIVERVAKHIFHLLSYSPQLGLEGTPLSFVLVITDASGWSNVACFYYLLDSLLTGQVKNRVSQKYHNHLNDLRPNIKPPEGFQAHVKKLLEHHLPNVFGIPSEGELSKSIHHLHGSLSTFFQHMSALQYYVQSLQSREQFANHRLIEQNRQLIEDKRQLQARISFLEAQVEEQVLSQFL